MCWNHRNVQMWEQKSQSTMNLKKSATFFAVIIMMEGCSSGNRFIEPEFPIIRETAVSYISHPDTIIPCSWHLEWDGDRLVGDGLLYNHWIHFFNPDNGCIERHSVSLGEGPGEIVQSYGMRRDNTGWRIYDLSTNMIYSYDDSLRYIRHDEVRLDSLPIVLSVFFIDNDRTVVSGRQYGEHQQESLCVLAGESRGNIYHGNPLDFDRESSECYSRKKFTYDPQLSCLSSASVYGGVIETFKIIGNEIEPRAKRLIYPLELSDDPYLRGPSKDCIIGVTAITSDSRKVIAALCGNHIPAAPTDITVWDWDLNPVARYPFGAQIVSMVHGQGKDELYAIVMTNDGTIRMAKILCPGLDDL